MALTELGKEWVKALRGEGEKVYKQGKNQLRNDADEYCCLGVLCDLSKAGEWVPELVHSGYRYRVGGELGGQYAFLPEVLLPELPNITFEGDLIELNDNGKTFAEIADYIEAHA